MDFFVYFEIQMIWKCIEWNFFSTVSQKLWTLSDLQIKIGLSVSVQLPTLFMTPVLIINENFGSTRVK